MLPLAIIWSISRKVAKAEVGGPVAVVTVALEMEKSRESEVWTVKLILLTNGQTGDGRKREELLGKWQEYKLRQRTLKWGTG